MSMKMHFSLEKTTPELSFVKVKVPPCVTLYHWKLYNLFNIDSNCIIIIFKNKNMLKSMKPVVKKPFVLCTLILNHKHS